MDFTMPKNQKSVLSADELYFFYYDIMRNTEDSIKFIYEWNNDILDFLDRKGIIVQAVEENNLPETIERNSLYFTIDNNDKNNKAVALFRHIRNAFAHFRIVPEGEYLNITDGYPKGNKKDKSLEKTMIGQIKYEDLKELCFLFFKQSDIFIEENNL